MNRGTLVRLGNGLVGAFLWAYENPVHRPGYEDRACVDVCGATWGANVADLRPVICGPQRALTLDQEA
jgi:hypothetical protein